MSVMTQDQFGYIPAYAGTYCACPRMDGQAELTWMAGYALTESPISALTGLDVE